MDKPTAIRRVRIAVSVFFGVLTVAILVLWVRSYRTCDNVSIRDAQSGYHTYLGSNSGAMNLHRSTIEFIPYPGESIPRYTYWALNPSQPQAVFVWNSNVMKGPVGISFPYWLPILVAAATAALPWLRFRFSLRALLIATTLVAVVLGLVCYTVR
jgi:hypothetical protein